MIWLELASGGATLCVCGLKRKTSKVRTRFLGRTRLPPEIHALGTIDACFQCAGEDLNLFAAESPFVGCGAVVL